MNLTGDYIISILRGRRSLVLIAGVVLFAASMFLLPGDARAETSYDSEELQFLGLINDYRADNGAGPLALSDDLTVAGDRHSEDMGKFDFFAHDTAQSSYYDVGSEPWDRMAAEGYDYNTFKGENLAAGYETAEEVFAAWKASPSHNEAMLDDNYKVVGVSRVEVPGSPYGWYWTTDFGAFVDPSSHGPDVPFGGKENDKPAEPSSPAPPDEAKAPKNAVRNGSFEDDSVWRQRARDDAALILNGEFVRLGGYEDGRDELSQKVRIKKDAKLSYDLKVASKEAEPFADVMKVRLMDKDGKPLKVLETYSGRDAGKWRTEELDLADFADRTVYLNFLVKTDAAERTSFYLDDVSVKD